MRKSYSYTHRVRKRDGQRQTETERVTERDRPKERDRDSDREGGEYFGAQAIFVSGSGTDRQAQRKTQNTVP